MKYLIFIWKLKYSFENLGIIKLSSKGKNSGKHQLDNYIGCGEIVFCYLNKNYSTVTKTKCVIQIRRSLKFLYGNQMKHKSLSK